MTRHLVLCRTRRLELSVLLAIAAFFAVLATVTVAQADDLDVDDIDLLTADVPEGDPVPLDADAQAIVADVWTDPGDLPRFQLEIDGKKFDLPLEHTHVDAQLVGMVAHVEVRQTYKNPLDRPIETVYVFPLPENSAVNDLEMVVGDRVVKADIKKRDEARDTYEQAKKDGHTAALLEQERPNIFTQ